MGGGRRQSDRRQGHTAALSGVVFALCAGLAGAPGEAGAGEGFALVGGGGALGGVLGGGDDGLHGYAGVIYAPAHSLSDTGVLLRGWAKAFEYSYRTDLPDRPGARIGVLAYGAQVEAGWQIAGPRGRVALLPGIAWRDYRLDPADPDSRLKADRIGPSIAADAEWRFNDRFGIMGNASYLIGFDEYWVQSRPFVHFGHGWKAGLDFAGWGGPDYDRLRAGVFTSGYELPLKPFGRRAFLGAEAGVQSDRGGKRLAPFAGMSVGVLF